MARMSRRERAARAVYALRPFRTAMSSTPLDRNITQSRLFDFDAAPAFYLHECYEIADTVLAAIFPRATPLARLPEQSASALGDDR